jgi:UDP-glucose 4-epimerase
MLDDFAASDGLEAVVFRYFNVAGADPEAEVGEYHRPETHLIPLILEAVAGQRPALTVHGDDYDTPDGTCIRDYVHVSDLVAAHVLGLDWLRDGRGSAAFNLGTGSGFSVREVIAAAERVTGHTVPYAMGPRRAGDATKLVSGSAKAVDVLGWSPRFSTLEQMISDAWRWHNTGGYGETDG